METSVSEKRRTYEEIINTHNFSLKEINYMKHALGIDRLSIKKGKCFCYRNYFNAGFKSEDAFVWNGLVFVGFANMYAKEMFEVTNMGIRFLEDVLSCKIEYKG